VNRNLALAIAAWLLVVPTAHASDIVACGQVVADGDTGVLQADLDCSADPGEAAVTLGNRSTLDMNGHAIIARFVGVLCTDTPRARCAVRGHGVMPSGTGKLSGGDYGIGSGGSRVTVTDVYVHDVGSTGIVANKQLMLTNVVVRRAHTGIDGGAHVTATNVTASENEYFGITASRIAGSDITASGNGYSGVDCQRCVLTRLTAIGNGFTDVPVGIGAGVSGTSVRLVDGNLTGNVVDGVVPVDVDTFRFPRLRNTTCDHSRQRGEPGSSWGLCAAD
jgi:hypothetical protein